MTAFVKSQLPDAINTVEELLVWASSILAELNAGTKVQVDRSNVLRAVDARPALLENEPVDPERFGIAAYIPLEPTWRGRKPWFNGVKELSTDAIPSAYTSNS
ncbi:MAG: hypothetical protein KME35_08060 [Aphanocapsa sp. GSE-SYN-MK-11-07L]|jgi:hypothetical protein|nr:hypothetical protein [Aphanocapsa sp. GSE-SYN-MK-11-07L]